MHNKSVLSTDKFEGMLGGCGLGGVDDHIKVYCSTPSHIKAISVLKLGSRADMAYVCWGEHYKFLAIPFIYFIPGPLVLRSWHTSMLRKVLYMYMCICVVLSLTLKCIMLLVQQAKVHVEVFLVAASVSAMTSVSRERGRGKNIVMWRTIL